MTLSASEVHTLKRAPEVEGLPPMFLERWSPRSFSEREVSAADLRRVFEAARWTASSGNSQPWRFIVAAKGTPEHAKLSSALAGFNQQWAPKAPVLILGAALARNAKGGPNPYGMYDLGAATAMLTLAASNLGLSTHQMAGFDREIARHELAIPEEYELGTVIALGYQGEPAALGHEELVKRELAPRDRKPLTEFVFESWGEPAKLG
jgi:nitroreductase